MPRSKVERKSPENCCFMLDLPYTKQNEKFKQEVIKLGKKLIIVGLLVCFLKTGFLSQCMDTLTTPNDSGKLALSWKNGWSIARAESYDEKQKNKALKTWLKNTVPWLEATTPEWTKDITIFIRISRQVRKAIEWTKYQTRKIIPWIDFIVHRIPDHGSSLLTLGCFLVLVGTVIRLKHSMGLQTKRETTSDRLPALMYKDTGEAAVEYEETPVNVDLEIPTFKFVKVLPYGNKRFPDDFAMNNVKMRLIIQMNKSTQM